jgi:type I restriction enzyme S subunit
MKAEEMHAEYAAAHQHDVEAVPLSDVTVPKIDQGGPLAAGRFTYVDISSVDNKLKRITEYKTLAVEAAPSRAKQRLKTGDVLVSMTRPNLNAVAIVPPDLDGAVGSTGFHVLRATEVTEPRWLYYAVQTKDFIAAMSELVQGALYPAVRPKDIRAYEIPHPPLDQQKRIVAEIEKQFSRLDEAVANLKRVKANLKRYKAAVLKAAVEGRLVETEAERARREGRSYETGAQLLQRILETRRSQWQGKGKYKEPAAPDTTDLPELPEGWVWASVEQIANLVTDGDHNPPKRTPTGVPHLTAKHIREWRVDPTDCTFISKDDAVRVFKRYHPKAGDLIVTCVGTVGRTAIVPNSFEFSPDRNLAAIRFFSGTLDVKFLQIVLESSDYQKLLRGASGSTAQPHLYLSDLRSLLIPLVATREQQRIVTEVDRLLSLITDVDAKAEANLKRAELLLKSTLSKAFRGQLMSEGAITVKVPEEYAVNGRAAAEKLTGARHEY